MQQLKQFQEIISRYTQNIAPNIPPDIVTHIPRLHDIKAVAFDVYGTLLHSTAGEISVSEAGQDVDIELPHFGLRIQSKKIAYMLKKEILAEHAVKKAQGIRYPEVDIVEIWKNILQRENLFSVSKASHAELTAYAQETALYYELQVNPVSAMPHARQIIHTLHQAGFALGIVSNAQFYTAHVLKYVLYKDKCETAHAQEEMLNFFSPCVWSYKEGEGKPSLRLYEMLLHAWPDYKPHEILFVGNDMRNDIAPPAALGIKTVLFAGDSQSYRPRKDMKKLLHVQPDACITNLESLATIVGVE